jgi:hypothetical protein
MKGPDFQEMSPAAALKHLDGVAENFHGTRKDHMVLQICVARLSKVIREWRAIMEEKKDSFLEEKQCDIRPLAKDRLD